LVPKDKVDMGLIEEPLKLPFSEYDNLLMAKEPDEEMGSPKSKKLPIGRTPVWKALAKTLKCMSHK